ncbi:hypothetical protein GCM10025780_29870 [Frondihabitans cladoniiphilus]|uniref:Secreted protein n=1 Tax=Frondihabitans cladoniiphilus TaxID=715785 RepID=A0ABP8W901_9MICO
MNVVDRLILNVTPPWPVTALLAPLACVKVLDESDALYRTTPPGQAPCGVTAAGAAAVGVSAFAATPPPASSAAVKTTVAMIFFMVPPRDCQVVLGIPTSQNDVVFGSVMVTVGAVAASTGMPPLLATT